MIRSIVVLPEPDGPNSATNEPLGASTVTSSRTRLFPKRFVIFLA